MIARDQDADFFCRLRKSPNPHWLSSRAEGVCLSQTVFWGSVSIGIVFSTTRAVVAGIRENLTDEAQSYVSKTLSLIRFRIAQGRNALRNAPTQRHHEC